MKTKWLLAGALLLAMTVSCVTTPGSAPDAAFAPYVKAYTGGYVSEQSPIRIELATAVPMEAQTDDLFSFTPSLKGATRWLSPTSVEFVPEALEPGKTYSGSFLLGKALSVKDPALKNFRFGFKVAERKIALTTDEIRITGDATVCGTLTLSQNMEPEAVQKAISITYPGGKPEVKVSGGPNAFQYEISGLSRGDRDRTLTIKASVKGFSDVSQTVTVPASGVFKVIDARLVENGNPHVLVQFSEPLGADSGATGLVEAGGFARGYYEFKDNLLWIYYEGRRDEDLTVRIDRNIKSALGQALGEDFTTSFASGANLPAVEIPIKGNILPDAKQLVLPLRAVNLAAVDVKVIRIYESNMLTFLQDNDLDEDSSLRRSGRLVYSKEVRLDNNPDIDLHQWNNFSIDLSNVFKQEPGAVYRVRVSFRPEHSLYGKEITGALRAISDGKPSEEEEAEWDVQNSWYWESFIDWEEYEWDETDDPTKPSYYMESSRFPSINILASDLGITAQYADGKTLWAAVTDLVSAAPMGGVKLEVYDYQLQRIGSGSTGGNGLAEIEVSRKPFILVARSGKNVGYLKLGDGYEKSFSRFDTGGAVVQKGLKGFIYGERGVWRPGDTMHLTLLVGDRNQVLPEGHPATMELYTPEGRFYTRMVQTGTDGFYAFNVPTAASDPTGLWNAYFKVGGTSFHKGLNIETVKPNRLKINLDLGTDMLKGGAAIPAKISSNWLTGPAAANLRAHADLTLTTGVTRFPGFEKYVFRNPASTFTRSESSLFETQLDENGESKLELKMPAGAKLPGMLNAFIVTSVEETGGDESFTTTSVPYSPYEAYVGVLFPSEDELETDQDQVIKVAVVSPEGKRLVGRELDYAVYKLNWKWWWETRSGELDAYVSGRSAKPIYSGKLTSGAQDASFTIRVDYPEWGRYLVYVRDKGGHASGKVITIDWPSYRGRADRQDPSAITMLTFSTDKHSYLAGEKATVYIPAAKGGKALVSLENGSGVISRSWVSTKADKDTPYTFTVSGDMAPNFFVHVTLIQPYGATENDLPLRMYGVQRISVENPASKLEPVITMADTVAPEEEFTVKVSEKAGKEMTYTLAIVDEGLLDITAFKTPKPWDEMYREEALGVRTYDLYDHVIGAFSGRFSPMLAVGGDEEHIRAARKDNRFNPVVEFLGPFTAKRGGNTHKVKLPMYVGSVRVMVVAGHDGAYGSTDKSVTVKAPLMVLSSLPRTASANETITLPVNVFAMEDNIREATVSVSVEGPVKLVGNAQEKLTFEKKGDKIARFSLETTGEGIAKISVSAAGQGHKASESIALEVKNRNPETVTVVSKPVGKGQSVTFDAGEGSTIELATFPAIDVLGVFSFAKNYPYNCSEQLSSRGLTLLSLLPMLPDKEAAEAKEIIPAIISALYARQNSDGGFIYWPGSKRSDSWVSSMAGAFLSQASAAGFKVQRSVLSKWEQYQKNLSQAFRLAGNAAFSEMDESYRLYSLAVASQPLSGAMNRLKEYPTLDNRARWMLAAAYAISGKTQTAKDLIGSAGKVFEDYEVSNMTYGSSNRDKAIALEVLALTGNLAEALPLAGELAESFGSGWYNTQEAAFTSVAMSRLYEKIDSKAIVAEVGGQAVTTAKSLYDIPDQKGSVEVKNKGEGLLYATMINVSRAPAGAPVAAASNGIKLTFSYLDRQEKAIDVKQLRQGTEFTSVITVTNPLGRAVTNLALNEMIPSGWEIQNERLRGGQSYDHQDIRDDGCNWFFDLGAGQSKTLKLKLRAAYEGVYILPSVSCEAMYEPRVSARTANGSVSVVR